MLRIGLGGILVGVLVGGIIIENSSPGSTKPAAEASADAAANWMASLGDMVSTAGHVVIPVASDLIDTARTEFPNVLGEAPADGGGTAQHPPAQPAP